MKNLPLGSASANDQKWAEIKREQGPLPKAKSRLLLAQLRAPNYQKLTPETLFTLPTNKDGQVEFISVLLVAREGISPQLREPLLSEELSVAANERRPYEKLQFRVYGLLVDPAVYDSVQNPNNYLKDSSQERFRDYCYNLKPNQFDCIGMLEVTHEQLKMFTREDAPAVQAYRKAADEFAKISNQQMAACKGNPAEMERVCEFYLEFPRRDPIGTFESECQLQVQFSHSWKALEMFRVSASHAHLKMRDGRRVEFDSVEQLLEYSVKKVEERAGPSIDAETAERAKLVEGLLQYSSLGK